MRTIFLTGPFAIRPFLKQILGLTRHLSHPLWSGSGISPQTAGSLLLNADTGGIEMATVMQACGNEYSAESGLKSAKPVTTRRHQCLDRNSCLDMPLSLPAVLPLKCGLVHSTADGCALNSPSTLSPMCLDRILLIGLVDVINVQRGVQCKTAKTATNRFGGKSVTENCQPASLAGLSV